MAKPAEHPVSVLNLRKRIDPIAEAGHLHALAEHSGVNYFTIIKIRNGTTPNPTVATYDRLKASVDAWHPKKGFAKAPPADRRPGTKAAAATAGA